MKKATTLKDIAKKLGVSVTTISKAINKHPDISDKRRKQVLETIKQMKYVPNTIAVNLRKNITRFIGLIISDNTNPYFAKLVKGAEEEITSNGYHTIIFNSNENPDKEVAIINELLSIKVAGVIITPAMGSDKGVRILKNFNIPYILANRYINKNKDNYVVAGDVKASFIATNYLAKNRFKKIIYINAFEEFSSARDRRLGYINALKKNNLHVSNNQIYSNIINQSGGYKVTKDILLQHKSQFSILCYSDYIASGVIGYLNEEGIKIPGEVAVMGIDNVELFAFSNPRLSTVSLPKTTIGRESAKILLNLIKNPKNPESRLVIEPKLKIRDSA